jgi:hypothetical protein
MVATSRPGHDSSPCYSKLPLEKWGRPLLADDPRQRLNVATEPTSRGGQPVYADIAIEVVLTLRLVFHLGLRQVEGFARSVLQLLGLEIAVPDHSTLARRGRGFAGRQPRAVRHDDRPVHVVLDSTGLQIFGQGEWDAEKHGRKPR